MLELGLHFVKGKHVPASKDKGLELIEKGIAGLGNNVPSEHCFEVGIMQAGISDEHGEKILKWQKLSAKLLEMLVANTKGMAEIETHMGQQAVMVVKDLLNSVKEWILNYELCTASMAKDEAKPVYASGAITQNIPPEAPSAYSGKPAYTEAPDYVKQSSMRACPNCYTKINQGEVSCSRCGQQASSQQANTASNSCNNCGCTFPNQQAQFCEKCGTKRMG